MAISTDIKRFTSQRRIVFFCIVGVLLLALILLLTRCGAPEKDAESAPEVSAEPTAEPTSAPTPVPENYLLSEQPPVDVSELLALREQHKRDGFPMLSWDTDCFATQDGRMTYTGSAETRFGIDVSEHQADIDWKAVAADGVEFAMIRLGRRGSTEGGLFLDEYFEKNIKAATRAGIDVGVYFYSQAITVAEAKEEAEYVIKALKPYELKMPVVFDWEIVGGEEARTYSVSRRTLCECTKAFCDRIESAGYDAMIYFTRYLGYRKYILRELTDYAFWYAEYEDKPTTAFDFDMWQYADTGTVSGIDGAVDMNLCFVS